MLVELIHGITYKTTSVVTDGDSTEENYDGTEFLGKGHLNKGGIKLFKKIIKTFVEKPSLIKVTEEQLGIHLPPSE